MYAILPAAEKVQDKDTWSIWSERARTAMLDTMIDISATLIASSLLVWALLEVTIL